MIYVLFGIYMNRTITKEWNRTMERLNTYKGFLSSQHASKSRQGVLLTTNTYKVNVGDISMNSSWGMPVGCLPQLQMSHPGSQLNSTLDVFF